MEILRKKLCLDEMWKHGVEDFIPIDDEFENKTPKERKVIEARFDYLMHKIGERRPKHPPYSEMIKRAIEALKEEGGSTETSISNYIKSTYGDEQLPCGHSGVLAQHLRKLTESGGLTVTSIPHYSLSLSRPGKQKQQQQQQQPNSDADYDDGYDPYYSEASTSARPPGKSREELLSHRERRKKFRFERQETQKEVKVETVKQPLLPRWPESQRRQRGRPKRNRGEQRIHPGKAMVDDGSGKEVMEMELGASNMESKNNVQLEFGRLTV